MGQLETQKEKDRKTPLRFINESHGAGERGSKQSICRQSPAYSRKKWGEGERFGVGGQWDHHKGEQGWAAGRRQEAAPEWWLLLEARQAGTDFSSREL